MKKLNTLKLSASGEQTLSDLLQNKTISEHHKKLLSFIQENHLKQGLTIAEVKTLKTIAERYAEQ